VGREHGHSGSGELKKAKGRKTGKVRRKTFNTRCFPPHF
jgi:hypothetical protein